MFTDEPMQKQNVIYTNLWAIFLGTKHFLQPQNLRMVSNGKFSISQNNKKLKQSCFKSARDTLLVKFGDGWYGKG